MGGNSFSARSSTAERQSGGLEAGGSSPTSSKCVNCGYALVEKFSVTIFDADGGETVLRNALVPAAAAGTVVVAVHDECETQRRRIRAARAAAGFRRSIPRQQADPRDIEVIAGGKTYTIENVNMVYGRDGRVLMCMPRLAE